jgi:hypothetical protein
MPEIQAGKLQRHFATLVAILLVVTTLSACGDEKVNCSAGLEEYKGKCLTHSAVVYAGCVEGRGESWTKEIGVGATLPRAAMLTLNTAYKRSRQENTTVALQIVKDCLKLAEAATTSGAERAVARQYRMQVTRIIDAKPKNSPAIAIDPSDTLNCGSVKVGAAITCPEVTITSIGWAPLKITRVRKSGASRKDFTVGDDECLEKSPLAPDEKCSMTVEFNPSAAGKRNATLVVQQNIPRPDRGTRLKLVGTGEGESIPTHTLTVTLDTSAAAFRVTSDPPGIDCPEVCTATFDDGTGITLMAVDSQGDGQVEWDECSPSSASSCKIHLNADRVVAARLSP